MEISRIILLCARERVAKNREGFKMVPKRFLFFPLFFPKTLGKLMDDLNERPLIYDEFGNKIEVCSTPFLHRFSSGVCVWCGVSRADSGMSPKSPPPFVKGDIPFYDGFDFNSPTTATVNVSREGLECNDLEERDIASENSLKKEFGDVEQMNLCNVEAYCLRCKSKVVVLDAKFVSVETVRGSRNYVRGLCGTCGSKINAIKGAK